MIEAKCKVCRRAGEKLFLKGERCFTPKCAVTRKPYPPGLRQQRKKRRGLTEFGVQLQEKQKLRNLYQIREEQFKKYVHSAIVSKSGDASEKLMFALERRLDNVVFLSGLARSRSVARQLVSHGHIQVCGKKVRIPSHRVSVGDAVSIAQRSWSAGVWQDIDLYMKKYTPPQWIQLDKEKRIATVVQRPTMGEGPSLYNTKLVIEYYAR